MSDVYEQKVSSAITVSRVFALISIVCAHIVFTPEAPYAIAKIYNAVASIGVICFLFASAYYYDPGKYSFVELIKNKFTTIGLPWLFLGTVAYLYKALISRNLSIVEYVKWIFGNGSYLYFLTVLFFCFIIFFKTNKAILYCAVGINLISLLLTATGIIRPIISALHITNYLNVFNWIGIFAVGMLVRRISAEKFYKFIKSARFVFLALFAVAVALICVFDLEVGYFSYIGIWLELLGGACILGISTIGVFENKFVYDISNLSFTVYLIHMMVIGVFDRLYNINSVTQALAVFIIVAICYTLLVVTRYIIKLIRLDKYLYALFGFRTRRIGGSKSQ